MPSPEKFRETLADFAADEATVQKIIEANACCKSGARRSCITVVSKENTNNQVLE